MDQTRSQRPLLYFFETPGSYNPVIEMVESYAFIRRGS